MRTARHTDILAATGAFFFAVSSLGTGLAEEESSLELELPVWSQKDATRFNEPGSALLGGGLWPIELQPEAVPALREKEPWIAAEDPPAKEPMTDPAEITTKIDVPAVVVKRPDEGINEVAAIAEPESTGGHSREIPADSQAAYFAHRPAAFLTDPQRLLSEQKTNDLSRFLEYHDGESAFAIYTLVFDGGQELPEGVSLRDLRSGWFGDESVVLVGYFLGEPKRAVLEFDEDAVHALGGETLNEVLESCIEDARVAENSFDQLERFCIELSIRLYWVEKENGLLSESAVEADSGTPLVEESPRKAKSATASIAAPAKASVSARLPVIPVASQGARGSRIAVYVLGILAVLAGVAWFLLRRIRTSNRTFVFPDYEVVPRLSAPHSGGGHAVMFFGRNEA